MGMGSAMYFLWENFGFTTHSETTQTSGMTKMAEVALRYGCNMQIPNLGDMIFIINYFISLFYWHIRLHT